MPEIALFHHVQGLTDGVRAFADELRKAGHVVHTPDLFEGSTFPTIDAGIAHAESVGFGVIVERAVASVQGLPAELVYGGFSMGAGSAQTLLQTRPGARAGLLFHGSIPPQYLGGAWPDGVPVQIHFMEDDPWGEEDIPAAKDLAEAHEEVELFLYPGDKHLFADSSVTDYDEAAAALLMERTLSFLEDIA